MIVFAGVLFPTVALAVPLAAVVSILPAYASYRWVEEPLRAKEFATRRHLVATVAGVLGLPLAAAAMLLFAANAGFWLPQVQEYQAAITPLHTAAKAGCHARGPLDEDSMGECTWNADAVGPPIYLVGDSHAEHWSEAVVESGLSLDRPVVIVTGASCPLVDVELFRPGSTSDVNARCSDYISDSLDFLAGATPGTVIISGSDTYWRDSVTAVGPTGSIESMSTDPSVKLATFRHALGSTLSALRGAGHQPVLVQTRPLFMGDAAWSPEQCSTLDFLADSDGCQQVVSAGSLLAEQGAVRDVVKSVAAEYDAPVLDTWDTLCGSDVCSSRDADLIRYRDPNHVTVAQSAAMTGEFIQVLPWRSG